jgi:hypothetical protein
VRKNNVVVIGAAVFAVTSALLTLQLDAAGQAAAGARAAQPRAQSVPAAGAIKRLADGSPDIRGTWVRVGGGMNEANAPDSELKAFGVLSEPQGFVDPANRQLPYTPEARAKRLDYAKNMCCPAKALSYLELSVRCAPPQPWAGGGVHIFQRPSEVALLFEQNHQTRVVYTDGRPHPTPDMIFFGGHSTGHWEGNDLVVDTTNLDGRAYYGVGNTFAPYSRQLHITERFTVVSDKLITFVLTYDDPKTFTRPVKVAGYLYPQDEDEELTPEFTCHEGSYAMEDIFGF